MIFFLKNFNVIDLILEFSTVLHVSFHMLHLPEYSFEIYRFMTSCFPSNVFSFIRNYTNVTLILIFLYILLATNVFDVMFDRMLSIFFCFLLVFISFYCERSMLIHLCKNKNSTAIHCFSSNVFLFIEYIISFFYQCSCS